MTRPLPWDFLLAVPLILLGGPCRAAAGEPGDTKTLHVRVSRSQERQVIDGFGGSLAFWGYDADEEALRYAFEDLGATIVRVPGEVARSGKPDEYRAVLGRVTRIAPRAEVLVAFWQPRSGARPKPADWVDEAPAGGYALKPSLRDDWAEEMVARLRTMRQGWGVNVVAASVQNEPDFSVPGSSTCRWEPEALAEFTTRVLAPRLDRAGLPVRLAAPDIAYVGAEASEAKRFQPVSAAEAVSIFAYHMYDSYRDGTADGGFAAVRSRQAALGRYLRDKLPGKRVWMTETTGAQWNGKEWHTLGWGPAMDEHDKALAAARYLHAALVDAQCNAFLWWGLVYSQPPASVEGKEERQKFRDEGLILVDPEAKDGVHPYRERTAKYYALKQFARFVRPGWVRLEVEAPPDRLAAAFRSQDGARVAVVIVNPERSPVAIDPQVSGDTAYRLAQAYVTDRGHRCEPMTWAGSLTAESVTTLIYEAVAVPGR